MFSHLVGLLLVQYFSLLLTMFIFMISTWADTMLSIPIGILNIALTAGLTLPGQPVLFYLFIILPFYYLRVGWVQGVLANKKIKDNTNLEELIQVHKRNRRKYLIFSTAHGVGIGIYLGLSLITS